MDLLVLCSCGHPQGMHFANGCQAGRFLPCSCALASDMVIDAAVREAKTTARFGAHTRFGSDAAAVGASEAAAEGEAD